MLNLNAMFGSCESIFDQPIRNPNVSVTDLQMMEMELSADLAKAEADSIKAAATMSQLDQVFNMYNHVKRFGVDRTFLSLFNSNGQLNSMLGMRFPSCESMDSEGYPGSNVSRAFLAAMEDEKEGIFAKIGKGIKWIWEKIKEICSTIWNKLKSWLGLSSKKNHSLLSKVMSANGDSKKSKVVKVLTDKRTIFAAIAVAVGVSAWLGRGKLKEAYEAAKNSAAGQKASAFVTAKVAELKDLTSKLNPFKPKTEQKSATVTDLKQEAKELDKAQTELDKATAAQDAAAKATGNVAATAAKDETVDKATAEVARAAQEALQKQNRMIQQLQAIITDKSLSLAQAIEVAANVEGVRGDDIKHVRDAKSALDEYNETDNPDVATDSWVKYNEASNKLTKGIRSR